NVAPLQPPPATQERSSARGSSPAPPQLRREDLFFTESLRWLAHNLGAVGAGLTKNDGPSALPPMRKAILHSVLRQAIGLACSDVKQPNVEAIDSFPCHRDRPLAIGRQPHGSESRQRRADLPL